MGWLSLGLALSGCTRSPCFAQKPNLASHEKSVAQGRLKMGSGDGSIKCKVCQGTHRLGQPHVLTAWKPSMEHGPVKPVVLVQPVVASERDILAKIEAVTKTKPSVTETHTDVTKTKHAGGRPKKADALSGAERVKAYRAREGGKG